MISGKSVKIFLKGLLVILYCDAVYYFIEDMEAAMDAPESHGAMIMNGDTLPEYLFSISCIIVYLLLGLFLIFARIKRRKLWITLHITPIALLIIYMTIVVVFFPEQFNI